MLSQESLVFQYQAHQAAKPVEGDDEENGGSSGCPKCRSVCLVKVLLEKNQPLCMVSSSCFTGNFDQLSILLYLSNNERRMSRC